MGKEVNSGGAWVVGGEIGGEGGVSDEEMKIWRVENTDCWK